MKNYTLLFRNSEIIIIIEDINFHSFRSLLNFKPSKGKWCPLRLPNANDVRFVFTYSCVWENSYLIYVICVCFRIVVSNAYCVGFYFVFFVSALCLVLPVFLDCPFLMAPSIFSNVYIVLSSHLFISLRTLKEQVWRCQRGFLIVSGFLLYSCFSSLCVFILSLYPIHHFTWKYIMISIGILDNLFNIPIIQSALLFYKLYFIFFYPWMLHHNFVY